MAFETFDLGHVLQTAQAIKGMQRQEADDKLRQQYMGVQLQNAQQAGTIAGAQETRAADTYKQESDVRAARTRYLEADAITRASDPVSAVQNFAPELAQQFDATHGQGTFSRLTPDQVRQVAAIGRDHAAALAGIQSKVKWQDQGGQLIATDENTGMPISGIQPMPKSASPDALLSAVTSRTNNASSIAATERGQDMSSATTQRGQDMTAATAREAAGGKVTETQGNAKAFGLRATAANTALESMISPRAQGGAGYNPTGVGAAKDAMLAGGTTTNWMASSDGQKYQNIAKAFIAPILRKESGAAISESEWTQAKQLYIPWPGDSAEVLAQKRENRANAVQGLSVQAGPGGIPTPHGASGGWSIEPVQ